jgi:acetyl esterase/lipase
MSFRIRGVGCLLFALFVAVSASVSTAAPPEPAAPAAKTDTKTAAPAAAKSEPEQPDPRVATEQNVVYGRGGETELLLDLARPSEGSGPFPALVLIHGGGWYSGSRSMYRSEIAEAARRGYVAVTVDYRLTDPVEGKARNPFPAQIEDVKCAVRWLRANADKYHIDVNRIGAKGASAGGHLSLLLATTAKVSALEGTGGHANHSCAVQAVVNYYGPTDLARLHETPKVAPILESLLGGPPQTLAAAYEHASPIHYISKDAPLILTIHGSADPIVPIEQANRFDERARETGATHTLLVLDGEPHGFAGEPRKQALAASWEFFDRHLKAK